MINLPELARCDNRNDKPKSHPTLQSPELWYSKEYLQKNGLYGLSFDFFVNWNTKRPSLSNELWVKGILEKNITLEILQQNILEYTSTVWDAEYLKHLVTFSTANDLLPYLILFDDTQDWTIDASVVFKVGLTIVDTNLNFNCGQLSLSDFKHQIQTLSGGEVAVGAKGLIYGTSRLECALSKTKSAYPGDLDLLVLDGNTNPVCILEFKKHTKDTPMTGQKLENYYPNPDRRKYDRIAIFRDSIRSNNPLPIFCIYYPTSTHITQTKIEIIGGDVGNLHKMANRVNDLPNPNNENYPQPLIVNMLEGIAWYIKTINEKK